MFYFNLLDNWHQDCKLDRTDIKAQLLKVPSMVRIKGIVVPADWDSNGKVISLAIATGDEQEYLIENQRQIADLWTLLRQEVVVTGSISCREKHRTIKVVEICQG